MSNSRTRHSKLLFDLHAALVEYIDSRRFMLQAHETTLLWLNKKGPIVQVRDNIEVKYENSGKMNRSLFSSFLEENGFYKLYTKFSEWSFQS